MHHDLLVGSDAHGVGFALNGRLDEATHVEGVYRGEVSSVKQWVLVSVEVDHVYAVDPVHQVLGVELRHRSHVVNSTGGCISAVRKVPEGVSAVPFRANRILSAGVVDQVPCCELDSASDDVPCMGGSSGGRRVGVHHHDVVIGLGLVVIWDYLYSSLNDLIECLGWNEAPNGRCVTQAQECAGVGKAGLVHVVRAGCGIRHGLSEVLVDTCIATSFN